MMLILEKSSMAVMELVVSCLHHAASKRAWRQQQCTQHCTQQQPAGPPIDAGSQDTRLLQQLQVSMGQFKHQLAVWKKVRVCLFHGGCAGVACRPFNNCYVDSSTVSASSMEDLRLCSHSIKA